MTDITYRLGGVVELGRFNKHVMIIGIYNDILCRELARITIRRGYLGRISLFCARQVSGSSGDSRTALLLTCGLLDIIPVVDESRTAMA